MSTICYKAIKEKILHNQFDQNCVVIEGKRAAGKTTLAIEKYHHMIEVEKIPSEEILVLYMNRDQGLTWRASLEFNRAGMLRHHTYSSFVQKELNLYWPLVLENCPFIKKRLLRPVYATVEMAQFMMKLLVDHFRGKKGYLLDIHAPAHQVCKLLVSNIRQAALSRVPFEEISKRLSLGLGIEDLFEKRLFEEIEEILQHYIDSFLEKGVLDEGLSIFIYHQYLLTDNAYQSSLKKRIKYLLIDNIEEASPAEIDLLRWLIPHGKMSYLFYNPEGGSAVQYGADPLYQSRYFHISRECLELEGGFDYEDSLAKLADYLESTIQNEGGEAFTSAILADFDDSAPLHIEMVEKVINKIKDLLEQGVKPQEICILSPENDLLLRHELRKFAEEKSFQVLDTEEREKLIENPFVHMLIILADICYQPEHSRLTEDDYRIFFTNILETNPIKGAVIAKGFLKKRTLEDPIHFNKFHKEPRIQQKYQKLYNWVMQRMDQKLTIDEFFRKAYLKILFRLPQAKDHMDSVILLADRAENFFDIVKGFSPMKKPLEKFFDFIQGDLLDSSGAVDEVDSPDRFCMLLTTPFRYLMSNRRRKVQIWTDIRSWKWIRRMRKELTNPQVLKNTWDMLTPYTEAAEEAIGKQQLIALLHGLLKKCSGHVYIYGSSYSQQGYEQQNMLAETLREVLLKGGAVHDFSRGSSADYDL